MPSTLQSPTQRGVGVAEGGGVALAVAWPDGQEAVFEGQVQGALVWPPRGTRGFGYDPVFVAAGETLTFGEMDPDRKHAMSHRADAVKKLRAALLP